MITGTTITMTNPVIDSLCAVNPLREPVLRAVIRSLDLAPGSGGLDVGCGIGLQALLLADAVGAQGHIIGLDNAPDLLAAAADRVAQAGQNDRITLQIGDTAHLPWRDRSFDWAWSADCIGYPAGDLVPILRELARVLRPGGRVCLLGWTSQQVLPGYPLLEAWLNAACSAYQPYQAGQPPQAQFMCAPSSLRAAGFTVAGVRTVVGEARAPLTADLRMALTALLGMLWQRPDANLDQDQRWDAYLRLCTPGSPDFILDDPDYYAFFTYTVIEGQLSQAAC